MSEQARRQAVSSGATWSIRYKPVELDIPVRHTQLLLLVSHAVTHTPSPLSCQQPPSLPPPPLQVR